MKRREATTVDLNHARFAALAALAAATLVCSCADGDASRGAAATAPAIVEIDAAAPLADVVPVVDAAPFETPFTPERISSEAKAMGTHLAFTAFTTKAIDAAGVHRAFDAAVAEIERIEALMTTWRPDSELSKVNAAAGRSPVAVGDETFAVIEEALHTSEISGGTFDITFEGLHGLWKFDEDLDPHPPTRAQVKARLSIVGYKHVHLDKEHHTVFLDKTGVKISLGGIAKGYAIDKAVAVLDKAGLTSFYAQAGGDLFARGVKPDGSAWSAGVRDPRGDSTAYFALLPVSDHAFSTAGDYERAYFVNGKRYHHIIDPRTGFPATASRSVTIYAPTAFQADAIDDAVFILGPEKGLDLVETLPDVGAVIVDAKNHVWISRRLQGKLRVTQLPTDAP